MTVLKFKRKEKKDSDLLAFLSQLDSVKNLQVYGKGEADITDKNLSPAAKRLLIREANLSGSELSEFVEEKTDLPYY